MVSVHIDVLISVLTRNRLSRGGRIESPDLVEHAWCM
jgi:hypothetical protein